MTALDNDFDPNSYRLRYADLSSMNDEQLREHYTKYGIHEGRIARVTARESLIEQISSHLRCLEIGPFNRPILCGENVVFADILNTEQLQRRAREIGIDDAGVPNITWVLTDGNLSIIDQKFDCVLSSHNIEHQVDLVLHLNQVSRLISDKGRYLLVIPDARYCFDYFIRPSTVADVLDSHFSERKKHSLKSIVEHRALTTHNDSARHWAGDHGNHTIDVEIVRRAIAEYNQQKQTDLWVDVHAWQFTPESFEGIISILFELELISLKVERIYPTVRNDIEFTAILRKSTR